MYLNLIKSNVVSQPSSNTDRRLYFLNNTKRRIDLLCSPVDNSLPLFDKNNSKALASSLFVFLNGHYLVVIRYYQSVSGKQRVLKKRLGNKSPRLKSRACVCDCHLLSLPWEKVMRLSSFATVSAQRFFFLLLHYIPVIFSHTIHVIKKKKKKWHKNIFNNHTNVVL